MEDSTKKELTLEKDSLDDLWGDEDTATAQKEADEDFLEALDLGKAKQNDDSLAEDLSEKALDGLDLTDVASDPPPLASDDGEETDSWFDNFSIDLNKEVAAAAIQEDEDPLEFLGNDNIANSYHPWRISLYEKLPFACEADGEDKFFLIGYQNGQTARGKETHFEQHETDPLPYVISLDPDPHFISYSFFYGFFRQTVEKMCIKHTMAGELRITLKKKIADEFLKKYTFDFRNNPNLLHLMREYVETMIENIMDCMEKGDVR